MPRLKGKIRYMNPGDLVVVKSPHVFVTNDGHIKNLSNPRNQTVTGHVKTSDSWDPIEIPYDTHAVLIDEKMPLIMMDEKIVMIPRSCIWKCKDE